MVFLHRSSQQYYMADTVEVLCLVVQEIEVLDTEEATMNLSRFQARA